MARLRRRSIWLALAIFAVGLLAFFNREFFYRTLIAWRLYSSHIFTPPPPEPGEARLHRLCADGQFYWDFARIPLARQQRLQQANPTLRPLVKRITQAQARGAAMPYSMHIYREVRWLLNFTPGMNATWAKLHALQQSLSQPAEQQLASEQQPDGSWARGIDTWYLKLYYSIQDIQACAPPPLYRLSFLDRINSPEALTAELNSALRDDFTKTATFNRERLDETFSALARLLRKPSACYAFHPALAASLEEFVDRWQNPQTGCWGQWLLDRRGRIWRMDDMGITFHVVSDMKGHVPHLNQIAKRLLQLETVNFPAGIRFNGHYENHLNADAVLILRYAWPVLDAGARQRASRQIGQMLEWCLSQSIQPDGSFKTSELDDTATDAEYYGVWFLDEAGYFNKQKRFWTGQNFPSAETVRARLSLKLKALGLADPQLREAYHRLEPAEPSPQRAATP